MSPAEHREAAPADAMATRGRDDSETAAPASGKSMQRVLVLSRFARNGSSSRLRHYIFEEPLRELGYELTIAPFFEEDYLTARYGGRRYPLWRIAWRYLIRIGTLLNARRFDLLWVEKEILPYMPAALEFMLLPKGIPMVLDFDDAWWHRFLEEDAPPIAPIMLKKFDALVARAAIATGPNEVVTKELEARGARDVRRISGAIDVERYRRIAAEIDRPTSGPLRVGWIGTPLNAERYLPPIMPILNELSASGLIEVHLIGAGEAVAELDAVRHVWSEDTEIDRIASLDVGIMPLSDDPFSRGKSGYKLVQFLACGRPVIGSPVGFNQAFLCENDFGIAATTPEEWRAALIELAKDRTRLAAMGARGQNYIRKHYSMEVRAREIAANFKDARRLAAPGNSTGRTEHRPGAGWPR